MVDAAEIGPMARAEAGAHEAQGAGTHKGASLLGQVSWALYDGARSPYNVLINIFVFSAYFSTVVIPNGVKGQETWSYLTSFASIVIAILAPVLGAIADAGGRRKPWALACLLLGAPCMSIAWFAVPGMQHGLVWVMAALVGAYVAFECSSVFGNAMLPNISPSGRMGFLSGLGFALGNAMGIVLFLFYLLAWAWNSHPLFGLDNARHEPERAVGVVAGIWWLLLAVPFFLFTPDSPSAARSIPEAVRGGFAQLGATLGKIGRYRNIVGFLIARMSFNEGFIALMLFTGVFAAGILHWTPTMLVVEGLINSVVATLAGFFAGWVDQRVGSKKGVMLFVGGGLIANIVVWSVAPNMVFFMPIDAAATSTGGLFPTLPDKVFLTAQCSVAFFVTGGLVTARSMMAKLSPRSMLNEFFGLYSMSGTATSFLGPLAIGIVTALTQTQRAGVAVGILFLAVGLLLMIPVKEEMAQES
jgi:UMF1 family MFS transporter